MQSNKTSPALDLIAAARQRQIEHGNSADPLQILSGIGADTARLIDMLSVPGRSFQQPAISGDLDLLAEPVIEFVGKNGEVVAAESSDAIAFVLPQFGRMYAVKPEKASNWDQANELGRHCTLLGFTDWNLPTDKEQELLVCRSRSAPTTYAPLVKHTPYNDWYWTRTPHPSASSCACLVLFYDGGVYWGARSLSGLVRACRRVSPRQ